MVTTGWQIDFYALVLLESILFMLFIADLKHALEV